MDYHQLALHRLFYDKPLKLADHMRRFGSADKFFENTSTTIDGQLDQLVKADIIWLSEGSHHLICITDTDYPQSLKEIHDPPYLLFASGNRSVLSKTSHWVAMVGSRSATRYGLNQAGDIAGDLAEQGVGIVSGMALGIDAAAHEGALDRDGATVAVLGTGCDVIYPRRHWRLAERISCTGLLLSEYPLGCQVKPWHFPMRNRIVAGMSEITAVVEATPASGSLISAKLAANEGREVMVLPGMVTNRQAKGCHQLLRDGASLLESASDILRELGLTEESGLQAFLRYPTLEPAQEELLICLDEGPMSMDMLLDQIGFSVEELTVTLVSLEVLGLVFSDGGRYQRAR